MIKAKYFLDIIKKYGSPQNRTDWKSYIHQQGGPWPSHIDEIFLAMEPASDQAYIFYTEVAPSERAANDS